MSQKIATGNGFRSIFVAGAMVPVNLAVLAVKWAETAIMTGKKFKFPAYQNLMVIGVLVAYVTGGGIRF